MSSLAASHRSPVANAVYGLLDPIPFGCFVATLIFGIIFANTAVMLWMKSTAWLLVIGLLFAVISRLINLVQLWITSWRFAKGADRLDFWLNLLAIVAAIFNAFVHTRDVYEIDVGGPDPCTLFVASHVSYACFIGPSHDFGPMEEQGL